MLENRRNYILKISFLYSLLIVILICIPAYFYTQLELNTYKYNQTKVLEEHSISIKRAIYDFSDSKSNIFNFPKSFYIHSTLLDKHSNIIYSTDKDNLTIMDNKSFILVELSNNRLNASSLVLTKEFSYKEIYLKIAMLTFSIGLFIFVSAYLIITASITPYKKANNFLDAFFNDAMHELKTPLGVIQINLEMLEEKHKESKEIKRSLNGLKNLFLVYEDIEYLIKHKRVNFRKELIDFSIFLNSRVEIFESLAKSKNINFELDIDTSKEVFINRTELQRVIDNTISNAIKYSNENQKVLVSLKKHEQDIIFKVQDFGKGIKDKSKIFNRYYRENSIKGGFGLGLNIVKNICDKNNIQIILDTVQNEGTTFSYIFKS